jgi:predicted ribonuclease YlaK
MTYKSSKLKLEDLIKVDPITPNQELVFKSFERGNHTILSGSAGTGKTFLALYLSLQEVLDRETEYDKLVIIRSIVPTRDIGFLPGTEDEKKEAYTAPYKIITNELFSHSESWERLVQSKMVEFESTSFIRGVTFNNAIILVDEMQNCNGKELNTIVTRIGNNCKIIMCGDYYQSDFDKNSEKKSILTFLDIMSDMSKTEIIEFTWKDIVRSDFVREYIMTKEKMGITEF